MTAISSAGPDVVKKRHATKAQNPQALKKKKAFSGPVQRVCKGLNELRAIGMDDPEKKWVAWMSDYVGESPGFVKALSLAKKEGLIVLVVGETRFIDEPWPLQLSGSRKAQVQSRNV